jgi:hypothetical protein
MTDRPSQQTAPPSIRLKRLVRHWGLVFLIALGFLLLALLVDETDRTVSSYAPSTSASVLIA